MYHPEKAKYYRENYEANQYREGKGESNPGQRSEKNWKPCAAAGSELTYAGGRRAFCNELRSDVGGEAMYSSWRPGAGAESESEQGVKSPEADAKPSDHGWQDEDATHAGALKPVSAGKCFGYPVRRSERPIKLEIARTPLKCI